MFSVYIPTKTRPVVTLRLVSPVQINGVMSDQKEVW